MNLKKKKEIIQFKLVEINPLCLPGDVLFRTSKGKEINLLSFFFWLEME